jgi:hypothetical protein
MKRKNVFLKQEKNLASCEKSGVNQAVPSVQSVSNSDNSRWIGHILRKNCLLQRVIEGKIQGGIEVTGRQGRRLTKLLDDFKERRGYSHLKEETLDRTMWRARFGRGFGPVVRQTIKLMK